MISVSYRRLMKLNERRKIKPKATRASFERNTLTFSGYWYKNVHYEYPYTPRTVDADSYLQYRRRTTLDERLSEFQARALAKEQKDKRGGLLELNIPIKSKAVESLFGEGGAGLKVSGYHRIDFSGRSSWDDRSSTATYRQSKFPSLNMEQVSRFEIKGTIGTKITVSVTQDSKTDIPLANRLIIRYKGEEDDIIKSIEAGNTNLALKNTRFVGYSQRIQGLFGLKTEAQIGGLNLTVIASQEKGTTERTSFSAGASATPKYIRDFEYYDGKIYDLGLPEDFAQGDTIVDIRVFKSLDSRPGEANIADTVDLFVDPNNPDTTLEYERDAIVEEMEPNEYWIDKVEHWITFNNNIATTQYSVVGVWMKIKRSDGTEYEVGDVNIEEKPYELKLIKAKNPDSTMVSWKYLWRNVYYLGYRNIEVDGLEIDIFKGATQTENRDDNLNHQGGVEYIRIFGLDRYDQSGNPNPDGLVDVNTPIIEPSQGLLIFPDRRPFNPADSISYSGTKLDSDSTVPQIYQLRRDNSDLLSKSQYYIAVSYKTRSADISLGKPNIIEKSEIITINGETMVRGQDYTIDYDFGRVSFITDKALDPNADIDIDFEYSPFIMAQKKTLFGIRGEYEPRRNLKVGATILYKSDKATDRKPRIGEETTKMFVWDTDASYSFSPNFLTTLANALPFYSTETPSNLALSGEVAQSYPNPNVDGVAYLDDFEGSRDAYSLGIFRENWHYASRPVGLPENRMRARLVWFNPASQVPTEQIWDRETVVGEGGSQTLWLHLPPDSIDRRLGNFDTTLTSIDPAQSWAGIMRSLTRGAANQDKAQLLELRLRVENPVGMLHVELGNISEDANGNDEHDLEDGVNGQPKDGFFSSPEDVGLDGLPDTEEPGYSANNNDPNKDNWSYNIDATETLNKYYFINGTQGDTLDPGTGGLMSTEDLDGYGSLDRNNDYFSFAIDLSLDTTLSDFYVDGSQNRFGWRTYRIPIRDSAVVDQIVGDPMWSQINFVRLWVESPTGVPMTVAIAGIDLISSNWEDTLIIPEGAGVDPFDPEAPAFNVAVINTQENENYKPPPGVTGFYNQAAQITEPEQSLLLHYENFGTYDTLGSDTGIVSRLLFDTPSLMGYRSLDMWVHGPPDAVEDSLMFFFRVGQDENNYYEFRKMLQSGWVGNNVEIDFNEITGLKKLLEVAREEDPEVNEIDSSYGRYIYRIYGKPNITKVKYMAAGVVTLATGKKISGDVWINELRLVDVRRDVGLAGRFSFSGNVADLFSYNFDYSYENSYFRRISSSTRGGSQNNLGSGKTSRSYSFGFSFKADRFLPRSFAANIPVSIRYSKSTSVPRLQFNSDIILPEEFRDEESSINTNRSFSISESFNKKTKNPLFTVLLNRFNSNFSYNRSQGRSPSAPYSMSENYSLGGNYNYSIREVPGIRLFFWTRPMPLLNKLSDSKLYFIPGSLTLTGNMNRSLSVTRNSSGVLTDNLRRDFRGSMKVTYKVFDNLNTNFSMDTRRDLSDPDKINFSFNPKKFRLGLETNFNQSFAFTYQPTVFAFLTHNLNYSVSYREDRNLTTNTLNAGSSKSYGVSGNLDLKKLFGKSQRRRPQPRQRSRGEDKTTVAEEGGVNIIDAVLDKPKALMYFLTSWLDPFGYDYKESYSYSYIGLMERAQLKFRFGLTEDIGAEIDPEARATGRSNSVTKGTSYSLRSGTRLLGGIKAGVSFNRSINEDIVKSVNPQKSVTTKFPDINFSIGQLSSLTFINPIIRTFSPRTNYSRSKGESIDLTTGNKTSESITISYSPLLSFSFNVFRQMQINVSITRSVSERKSFDKATGDLTDRRRSTTRNTDVNTKYSFSWPTGVKIPLFGRLKFKSTMNISLRVTMRTTRDEQARGDAPLNSPGSRSELQIVPGIDYNFSSQIRGGLSGQWTDTNDRQSKSKSHTRMLRIWVEIRF